MIMQELREVQKLLDDLPEADWIHDMRKHFAETGSYRPEDLIRLLGDIREGVTVGEDVDETIHLAFPRDEKTP